jgi:prepilin-type N-terminal cleavage/methylation domain-containing protein
MKYEIRNKKRSHTRGMTLAEVMIAMGIFVVIMTALVNFYVSLLSYRETASGSLENTQDTQILLKTLLREMRSMAPGANGAYALTTAGTSTLTFFSDADLNGVPEQITYSLATNQLSRGVIQPTGTPPTYPIGNLVTKVIVTNVRNSSTTPVFEYFDTNYTGTSTPLGQPVTVTNVRLIRITLTLDVDPNHSPLPVTYSTQVNLRNLKSNL